MKPPSLRGNSFNNSSEHVYYNQPNQALDILKKIFIFIRYVALKIAGFGNG